MTFDTMVSNIGGQIGLWMGASLLSVVQLVAALVAWCKEKIKHKKEHVQIEVRQTNPVFTHMHS